LAVVAIERVKKDGEESCIKYFDKRLIDIVLSALGIVILSPMLLILEIAIKVDSPGSRCCFSRNEWAFTKHISAF